MDVSPLAGISKSESGTIFDILFKVSFLKLIKLADEFDFNIVYELGKDSGKGIRKVMLKDDKIRGDTIYELDNRKSKLRQH